MWKFITVFPWIPPPHAHTHTHTVKGVTSPSLNKPRTAQMILIFTFCLINQSNWPISRHHCFAGQSHSTITRRYWVAAIKNNNKIPDTIIVWLPSKTNQIKKLPDTLSGQDLNKGAVHAGKSDQDCSAQIKTQFFRWTIVLLRQNTLLRWAIILSKQNTLFALIHCSVWYLLSTSPMQKVKRAVHALEKVLFTPKQTQ